MKQLALFVCICCAGFVTRSQSYQPTWESLDKRPVPAWYTDAKFGIFIHWGLYSVPSWATNSNADGFGSGYSEWYWQRLHASSLKIHKEFKAFHEKNYGNMSYQDFAPMFKAELFDADKWADIIKNAGAKYVVLTSKHHDGFALWPSKQSWNWNAKDVGPHKDLAGEISTAVKKAGLRMGFYYSLYEWYNPLYKTDLNQYVDEHMLPQMKDLVNSYQPDIFWPDGQWEHSDTVWKSREFLTWLYNESPVKDKVVVNDRWGKGNGHGSFSTTEYGSGNWSPDKPWEECRGIGESFGYNRNENLESYLSSEQLVHSLVDIVSRGGNLLLNIGPTSDGRIPVIMQQRLKDAGDWLKVNGEAIYGTAYWSGSKDNKTSKLFFTKKANALYVITTDWTETVSLQNIPAVKAVSLLGYKDKVSFRQLKNNINIKAPAINPGNMPCQYAWVYKLELQ